MAYNTELVKQYWSEKDCSESEKNFYLFPAIRKRSCKLIFNEDDASNRIWCEYYTVEKYLKSRLPFEKCLSICCGFGKTERTLAKLQAAKKFVGTDIAPGALEEAKKRAQAEGVENVEYFPADLNTYQLPDEEYDLVWANGALHHITELDLVVSKLHKTMRIGGYLISNEYVGPKYQQISPRQQELVNAVKHLLPPELRGKALSRTPYGGSIFAKGIRYLKRLLEGNPRGGIYDALWEMPPVEFYLKTDPSECVGSHLIIPTLKKYFDVEVRYYNGSILSYALDKNFFQNFDESNRKHVEILEMLFRIEDSLVSSGEINHDHAHIICHKVR